MYLDFDFIISIVSDYGLPQENIFFAKNVIVG